ncbi:phosphoribosylaminoimidazolesuccinocarboxamide synthase [Pontibacter mangrovi]|uniref:Phosphoribosylaminoimidazole-succinocarboxamide synthase n=1 Tax=Pontibacter mangrovi TaxID=2589816 RepID=A0A501WGZ5_9BACT|nr:phosphoribosylaminoimidazolesuccinocarboxamide synthase [Pontibacter mangrovi]TPE46401.1 phosphoribosylaminoimidazolesuccinocarboxamide synthase [Pontibacter mangrovi]
MEAIKETNFSFAGQTGFYRGKVRDVYYFDDRIAVVATDRISAFDVVLPRAIPYKGQVLNQIAGLNLKATADVVPNWVLSTPDPNVTIGYRCEPFKVEMVIRGYLAGHAWREYKAGKRTLCGVSLPDGLRENDKLPSPIITPTTKADEGHDEDISREDILAKGLVSEQDYINLEHYTRALYERGTELARERGLILVDTKYEFGKYNGEVFLIDEIHTPDSSRYFYSEGYQERQQKGEPQRQLSKEFVRQWLIEHGFQGKEGQQVPQMTDAVVNNISERYIELYEVFTGHKFEKEPYDSVLKRIEQHITDNIFTAKN